MGKVLVLCYICVPLEMERDIICLRGDTCWHLAPSSFSQAPPHPLAPWRNKPSCGDVLLVGILAWWQELGWFGHGNDLSLLIGTVTGSALAHTSSPWLRGMSYFLLDDKSGGEVIDWPDQDSAKYLSDHDRDSKTQGRVFWHW